MATKWHTYDAELRWAKIRESNRDMGPGDDSDVGRKLTEIQGQYSVDMIVTDEVKAQMVADGVPEVVLGWPQFKQEEDVDGWIYKAKRPHFNPKFKAKDSDEMGVVMGEPVVSDYNASQEAQKIVELEGLIGNGSKGKVKLAVYKGRATIVTLEGIGVTDLVEYESDREFI